MNSDNLEFCRAFTLFNDKILSEISFGSKTIEQELSKDFLSIGFYDWFQTERLEKEPTCELQDFFYKIYHYNLTLNKNTCYYQSFQNIFGFRSESKSDNMITDEQFWAKNDIKFPLKFICFLQLDEYNKNNFTKIQHALSQYRTSKKLKYIVYHTLDKNDFIVCFKSNKYKIVMEAINQMYIKLKKAKENIIYSYTNFVVEYDMINNGLINIDEEIDSICIKTILNNKKSDTLSRIDKINSLNEMLAKELFDNDYKEKMCNKDIVGYEILGDFDCRFIARKVPLNKVINLYSKFHIFNRGNKIFSDYFLSSMTSLNVDHQNNYLHLLPENIVAKAIDEKVIQTLAEIDHLIDKISNNINNSFNTIIYQLKQVKNYITYSYTQPSQTYEAKLLINSFLCVVNIINNNIDMINSGQVDFDEIFQYMNDIYTNIQGNMRADIRIYQISDFSVMSYYAPTKLRVFYSSLANLISDFYSSLCHLDKGLKYKFITAQTNNPITNVKQVWEYEINVDKLMIVYLSENDLYNIKDLIIQIAHEVAHYVGNETIRNRKKRFNIILDYFEFNLYNSMCVELKKELIEFDYYNSFEQDIVSFEIVNDSFKKKWQTIIEEYKSDLINKRHIDNGSHFYYTQNIERYMPLLLSDKNIIQSLYDFIKNNYIDYIKNNIINENKDLKTLVEIFDLLEKADEKIVRNLSTLISRYTITESMDYDMLISLMSESYSDMCAVLLLDLDINDYFQLIKNRLNGNNDYKYSTLFLRGCIITKALSNNYNKNCCYNSSYYDVLQGNINNWNLGEKWFNDIINICENKLTNRNEESHYAYEYVKECVISFCNIMSDDTDYKVNKRNELIKLYRAVCKKDLITSIQNINEFVQKIKDDEILI